MNFLCIEKTLTTDIPLILIAYSAGVVGAIGVAWAWQLQGWQIKTLIAIDGWGMPMSGDFPIYRVSHDYFTHWSWGVMGSGDESFYAYLPVEHLEIWRSLQTITGWWLHKNSSGVETVSPATAREFIAQILEGGKS